MAASQSHETPSVHSVPGCWRDRWDDPDDHARLRAVVTAAEDRLVARSSKRFPIDDRYGIESEGLPASNRATMANSWSISNGLRRKTA